MRTLTTLLLLFVWAAPAWAQDHAPTPTSPDLLKVVVKGDRIVAQWPNGKLAWAIQHLSAGRDQKSGEVDHPIVGPVEFAGDTMYAIRGDLLTLDTKAGRIIARQQYPAIISDLVVKDDELEIELDIRSNRFGDTTKVRTPYTSGLVPGRGPWESFAFVALRASGDVPDSLTDEGKFHKRTSKWTAERQILKMAEERDPTNPLLPAYRGLAAHADGDEAIANTAFAKAIVAAGLWHEQLQVCGILERAQRPGLAESTCTAAKESMAAQGIRPEAMLNLIAYVVTMKHMRFAMEDAVAREDADAVHRILGYTYEMFPNVEAGFMAYDAASNWFAERDDPRAEVWSKRATETMNSPFARAMWGRGRTVDFWILLLSALFFALPIAGLGLGLRRTRDDREARWNWLPRPTVLDVVVLAVFLVAMIPISIKMMTEITAIGDYAEAPIAVTHEGFGSPNVVDWLNQMPESPARNEVLDYAQHELEAARAGKPVTMKPPDAITPLIAIEELAGMKGQHEAFRLSMTSDVGGMAVPNAVPFMFPGAFIFLLFAIFGRVTRKKVPEVADTLSMFVPGAHARFGALVLVTALIAGGLYLFTPIGTILMSIATPAFGKYFGLASIDDGLAFSAIYPMDRVWAWTALIGAIAVHVVTTVIARRSAS